MSAQVIAFPTQQTHKELFIEWMAIRDDSPEWRAEWAAFYDGYAEQFQQITVAEMRERIAQRSAAMESGAGW